MGAGIYLITINIRHMRARNKYEAQQSVASIQGQYRHGRAVSKLYVHEHATRNKKQTPERLHVRAFFGNTSSVARSND